MNDFFADRTLFAWAIKLLGLAFATGLVTAYYSRVRSSAVHCLQHLESLVAAVAWALLSWALFVRGNDFGHLPVSNIFEVFQSLGWCALFFVVFLRAVWGLRVPVVLGTGIAWALCALGNLNAKNWDILSIPGSIIPGEPWISVHATLATVGYACFSAASTMWLIYLLQNSALRKRFSHPFFSKLPDLNSLDRIAGRLCAAGLVILGTGILVGIAAFEMSGKFGSGFVLYKTILSAALFVGFLGLAVLRRRGKISALKCARYGLGIFVAALIFLGGSACIKHREIPENAAADSVPAKEHFSEKPEGGSQ